MDEAPAPDFEARRLVSGTAVLFVARLLVAFLALGQTILLATFFGTSASTDAYFIASAVCFLFIGPAETALNVAFVPAFVHTAEAESEASAWKIAASLFRVGLFLGGVLVVALSTVAPWLSALLAPGLDDAASELVAQLIREMAPAVLFVYAASFVSNMEFIAGRYLLPAAGMIVYAAAGPLALILFADQLGVRALAGGIVAGAIARCLVLMVRFSHVRRLFGGGVSLRDPTLRQLGATMVSRLATSWLLELNLIVDRIFASWLGLGFVSALAYANRAVMAIVRLFMMPMGRVLLPSLSRLAARKRYERIRGLLEKVVVAAAFVLVPLVAYLLAFRVELLSLLFERGAFDQASVEATAEALFFYALGIIPFLVTPLLSGTFFALKDSATPLKIGAVCVLANVLLDAVLVLRLGHGGIALATSFVGALRASLLWIYVSRRLGAMRYRSVLGSLLLSAAAATFSLWCARLAVALAGSPEAGSRWELPVYGLIGGAAYLLLQGVFNRPVTRLIAAVLGRMKPNGLGIE